MEGALREVGGKGAFVTELDQTQLAGGFEIGVHCSKGRDGLPTGLDKGAAGLLDPNAGHDG